MMTAKDYGKLTFEELATVADRLWIAVNNPRTKNADQVMEWYRDVSDRMIAFVLAETKSQPRNLVSEVRAGWKSAA